MDNVFFCVLINGLLDIIVDILYYTRSPPPPQKYYNIYDEYSVKQNCNTEYLVVVKILIFKRFERGINVQKVIYTRFIAVTR